MQLSVIDVSEHQGNINWEKVKNAGVVGAMIRTGYGVKDPNQIDKWFYNNLSGCQNVGMPYGFYHYSYAVDVAGAEQEADFCLELVAESNPQYPVALIWKKTDRQHWERQYVPIWQSLFAIRFVQRAINLCCIPI